MEEEEGEEWAWLYQRARWLARTLLQNGQSSSPARRRYALAYPAASRPTAAELEAAAAEVSQAEIDELSKAWRGMYRRGEWPAENKYQIVSTEDVDLPQIEAAGQL
ncbi:uncharacterized protein LTR77_008395 [Saxophila tyrrhenica]|uniref:Uncharacterized protein n=1 Tax=Saxophila tyrrhenica TaxID=1690608 RepID=A0AAV9P0Q9_9PEZI|nr:hypothetical protein LTR77_008395 [Saxophila tyrrhenica]